MPSQIGIVSSDDPVIKTVIGKVLSEHQKELASKSLRDKVDFVSIRVFNELSLIGSVFDDSVYDEVLSVCLEKLDSEIADAKSSFVYKPNPKFNGFPLVQSSFEALQRVDYVFMKIKHNLNPVDYEIAEKRINYLLNAPVLDQISEQEAAKAGIESGKELEKSEASNSLKPAAFKTSLPVARSVSPAPLNSKPDPRTAVDTFAFVIGKKRKRLEQLDEKNGLLTAEETKEREKLIHDLKQLGVDVSGEMTQKKDPPAKQSSVNTVPSHHTDAAALPNPGPVKADEKELVWRENRIRELLNKFDLRTLTQEDLPDFAVVIRYQLGTLIQKVNSGAILTESERHLWQVFSNWRGDRIRNLDGKEMRGMTLTSLEIAERNVFKSPRTAPSGDAQAVQDKLAYQTLPDPSAAFPKLASRNPLYWTKNNFMKCKPLVLNIENMITAA